MLNRIETVLFTVLALASTAGTACGIGFPLITYENAHDTDLNGLDLWFDVADGGNHVEFTFHNSSTIASNVANIYFESSGAGLDLGAASISGESSGVDFSEGGNPANPAPGANPLNWSGTEFRFRARNPAPHNGIKNVLPDVDEEWLAIRFDYGESSFDEVIDDLESGEFRVAQHVTGMPESIWTASGATDPVPLPATVWLFGPGLLGWIGARRFRQRG